MKLRKSLMFVIVASAMIGLTGCGDDDYLEPNFVQNENDNSSNDSQSSETKEETPIVTKEEAIYEEAKEAIKDNIETPATAEFPECGSADVKIDKQDDGSYHVTSYVDCQNLAGAMLRHKFVVSIKENNDDTYTYQIKKFVNNTDELDESEE